MKKALRAIITGVVLLGATAVFAGDSTFSLKSKTFVFDPDHTGIASAKWEKDAGLADSDKDVADGKAGKALVLKKLGPTPVLAASGMVFEGVSWLQLRSGELGFDLRNDSHKGAGAPRFNVQTANGVTHFCGAAGASSQMTFTDPQGRGWTRIRFSGGDCSDPILPTDIVTSIAIIFDEGTDTGPDFTGTAILDNISINGTLIRSE